MAKSTNVGHLILTGYRAVGKSVVAASLAQKLGRDVIDLDQRIIESQQRSIADIFATDGEDRFRDLESEQLAEAIKLPPSILSLGGGTIIREANRKQVCRAGRCVWLTAPAEVIAARMAADESSANNRPSLTQQAMLDEIRDMLDLRDAWYREVADLVIQTQSKSIEAVVDEILDWW